MHQDDAAGVEVPLPRGAREQLVEKSYRGQTLGGSRGRAMRLLPRFITSQGPTARAQLGGSAESYRSVANFVAHALTLPQPGGRSDQSHSGPLCDSPLRS